VVIERRYMKNGHLSIEQLERDYWPVSGAASHLVERCHALRKIPICELNVEDIRILVGQGIGLPFLVPIALRGLLKNPYLEGDFFAGDLLMAIVKQKRYFETATDNIESVFRSICKTVCADQQSPLPAKTLAVIKTVL